MFILISCLSIMTVLFVSSLISNYFLVPLPYFRQYKSSKIGKVTKIEYLSDMYEVTVIQQIEVSKSKNKSICLASVSVGSFIHFRKWQQLPIIGDLIEADTLFYYFSLRGKGFSFVKSWKSIKEIPISARVKATMVEVPDAFEGGIGYISM